MADASRGFYSHSKQRPPSDLIDTFSSLSDIDAIRQQDKKHWEGNLISGVTSAQLETAAIRSMIRAIDPVLQFVPDREFRVQRQLSENRYVGIGIQLARTDDGYPKITKPFYGGAAQKAGAQAGDLIVSVDGIKTHQRDFGQVIQDLRGAENTEVVVELRHESEDIVREKKMIRTVVPIDSIVGRSQDQSTGQWDISIQGNPKIAHLRFDNIVGSTAAEMTKMARQIEQQGFEGVIYDFRNIRFGGIDLHHATMLADVFTNGGKLGELVSRDRARSLNAQPDSVLSELPALCLCNENTTGPQFLVMSALANLKNVKIIGTPIRSNGICRRSAELKHGGALQGIAYGKVLPNLIQRERMRTEHEGNELYPNSGQQQPLVIPADIELDYSDQEGLTMAIRSYFKLAKTQP